VSTAADIQSFGAAIGLLSKTKLDHRSAAAARM
jgi:hypothetical protein